MSVRRILVTGATGKQGGAVVQALLEKPPPFDHSILALTRNVKSSKAQALAANANVELVAGDLSDCDAIFAQAGGPGSVWGVFAVTMPDMRAKDVIEAEERQGRNLVDAALKNDVKRFVLSSVDRGGVASDSSPTEVPHFISKHHIEQHLKKRAKDSAMTWTILRPVAFMDNMQPGMFCKLFNAMWLNMGQKKLQLVATKDIGRFAALAFAGSHSDYDNISISLAGDELTQEEGNEVFWRVYGRSMPRTYCVFGSLLQWAVKDVGIMFKWFQDVGYGADIQQCKKLNPSMMDLETWFKEESSHKK